MNEKNKFKIVCQKCGCENCTIVEDWGYDYDEVFTIEGHHIVCPECGQHDKED